MKDTGVYIVSKLERPQGQTLDICSKEKPSSLETSVVLLLPFNLQEEREADSVRLMLLYFY